MLRWIFTKIVQSSWHGPPSEVAKGNGVAHKRTGAIGQEGRGYKTRQSPQDLEESPMRAEVEDPTDKETLSRKDRIQDTTGMDNADDDNEHTTESMYQINQNAQEERPLGASSAKIQSNEYEDPIGVSIKARPIAGQ